MTLVERGFERVMFWMGSRLETRSHVGPESSWAARALDRFAFSCIESGERFKAKRVQEENDVKVAAVRRERSKLRREAAYNRDLGMYGSMFGNPGESKRPTFREAFRDGLRDFAARLVEPSSRRGRGGSYGGRGGRRHR